MKSRLKILMLHYQEHFGIFDLLTSLTTGELTLYSPINPTGNIDTRFVNLISENSLKSNVLSSSPKYKTPSLMLLFLSQVRAARRLETPLGIDL